jgi:putative aldouronate transport system substrate-binding protein
MMRRRSGLFITGGVLVLTVLLAACGRGSGSGGSGAGGSTARPDSIDRSNFTDLGTYPVVKEKVTINVLRAQTGAQFNADTNLMTQFYENKTGVHVNWTVIPPEQFKERANLALASEEPLDCIISGGHLDTRFQMIEVMKLAEQELILPIQDLIETDSIYFKKILDETPGWRQVITHPSGGIYNFPASNDCFHCQYYGKMWVNLEFLKNLNLQIPTTTQEFHDMLLAFKNQDANGNGDPNDEIPMLGTNDNFSAYVSTYLMSAFVYDDGENRLYLEDGKVVAAYQKPEFQDGLRYLHQLFSEGLISRDSFTIGRSTRAQMNSTKYESIVGALPNSTHGNLGTREAGQPVRWIDYEPIKPLVGPKGLQITRYHYYDKFQTDRPAGFIPATSKNPALIIRWLDWLVSNEGTMMLFLGEKEQGWTDADPGSTGPDGRPAVYQTIPMSPDSPYYGNFTWDQYVPYYRSAEFRLTQQTPEDMRSPDGLGAERLLYMKTLENYAPYGMALENLIPPLYYQEEEISDVATLTTNINTYVQESLAKFVVGDMNIETDWGRFQNELNNLGIDRYLQIIQKTYDNSAFAKK